MNAHIQQSSVFAGLGDIGSPLIQVFLSRFGVVIYYNGDCDTKPYGLLWNTRFI